MSFQVKRLRSVLFPRREQGSRLRVCVPVTGFPITGGTRSVLAKIEQVTEDSWQLEYLTQHLGPGAEEFATTRFGTRLMSPWSFPTVWLYYAAGLLKLVALLRRGAAYDLLLPQDGVFTAAFTAVVGKLADIRVVCIDHGNLTLLYNQVYRKERIAAFSTKYPALRLLATALYACYWPSLAVLARISARMVDHFLIPGVPGDDSDAACRRLGIAPERVTRFATMIDGALYGNLNAARKGEVRKRYALADDAIVISMICRLTPEKGIDIALEALSQALSVLDAETRERVRVVIAGKGPLRADIVRTIDAHGLRSTFVLTGEVSAGEVIALLGISDIFLYTSIRGACLSMAVLEAMASGCAVVASTLPLANVTMLAEGRGISVPPGDVIETRQALLRLILDEQERLRMGERAREYVALYHNAAVFRDMLSRATQLPVSRTQSETLASVNAQVSPSHSRDGACPHPGSAKIVTTGPLGHEDGGKPHPY